MAHFAKLDSNNIVTDIYVVSNDTLLDQNLNESEDLGKQFLNNLHGSAQWVQTSYNGSFRKNYAGIGYKYDSDRDAFIPPKPFKSWILNESTCVWQAPVSYPTNVQEHEAYEWDEDNQLWNLI